MSGESMKVVNYFDTDNKEHWLDAIGRSDWRAGPFLKNLLESGTFFETVGEGSLVLLLTEGDELVSYCTYAEKDDIRPTELTPWVGFVYTFPARRGHRFAGLLFDEVERLAREDGVREVYLSTNHVGLYEKYGWEFMTMMTDMDGAPSRIYVKRVAARKKVMVSACLLGQRCKYNGGYNYSPGLAEFLKDCEIVPVCPEVAGGLSVPRRPCEIRDGAVVNDLGESVDAEFRAGAELCLRKAFEEGAELAVLQPRSPSCGSGRVYDGTFSGRLTDGDGVFAAALKGHGIKVVSADELPADKEGKTMKQLIGYCGLDCEKCEARIATVNNDDALRAKVAKLWSELNHVEITPEMINCLGCRVDGPKTVFCDSMCAIRKCAAGKAYETCGGCAELDSCEKLRAITLGRPDALERLKNGG